MTESEGLAKLTEYLKQTRRQAEIAIDNLNSQLADTRQENELMRNTIVALQKEREENAALIQQLKAGNGSKSKFKERDEWKALVENIQQDRDRLQTEYNHVVSILEEANVDLARTKQDLAILSEEYRRVCEENHQLQQRPPSPIPTFSPPSSSHGTAPLMSPVLDRRGQALFEEAAMSPMSMAMRLKQELRKTNEEVRLYKCHRTTETVHVTDAVRSVGQ